MVDSVLFRASIKYVYTSRSCSFQLKQKYLVSVMAFAFLANLGIKHLLISKTVFVLFKKNFCSALIENPFTRQIAPTQVN